MKMHFILAASISLAVATAAFAEQTYSNDGVGTAMSTATALAITEGHVLIDTQSAYSNLATEDPANPLNGAAGPCFGSMEIIGATISGSGHCAFTDGGGDIAIIAWQADTVGEGGVTGGTWSLTGGNGKYTGASGSGRYEVATKSDTNEQTNTVTGEITLP